MSEHIKEDLPENEAELLLPFYVNGTLDERDRQIVEHWLSDNAEAADHLARAAEELEMTRADAETLGVPSRRVLDNLMSDIGEAPGGIRKESLVERIWAMLSPRYALAGAAAFALVIAAQAGYFVYSQQQAPATFQTASGQADAFTGPTALVVFAPTAEMGAVSARLAELGLVIVDGPKPGGIFVVGAKEGDEGRAALAELGKTEGLTSFFNLR
jgi:anti-sigma-K factor RskA